MLALLTVLYGVEASSSLVAQKGPEAFSTLFDALFTNGVEDTAIITRKIKIVGACRMLTEEGSFYSGSPLPLAEGVVMLVKIVNHDGRTSELKDFSGSSFLQVVMGTGREA